MTNVFGFLDPTEKIKKKKFVGELKFADRPVVPYVEMNELMCDSYIGDDFSLDIECYPNYFLILLVHFKTRQCITFELSDFGQINFRKLYWCLSAYRFYTFNGNGYDMPMLDLCLKGYSYSELKVLSNELVDKETRRRDFFEKYNISENHGIRHIDLMDVCPLDGSLKKYSGRLHAVRMQELPYDHMRHLNETEQFKVSCYCFNDNQNTILIRDNLLEQLSLRQRLSDRYNIDLMSKSDAQIAEAVIVEELKKVLGYRPKRPILPDGYSCQYKDPGFLSFRTPHFKKAFEDVCKASFYIDGGGSPRWPVGLGEQFRNDKGELVWGIRLKLGESVYKMGTGGLHSSEKSKACVSDDEYIYIDRDVESYYPRIIINQRLAPKHLGEPFLVVYEGIVDERIAAKKAKNKADANSLKIVINGSFGKLGDMWSRFYSPDLLLQTTLTGQFSLLMLIEMLHERGISVVSANTDGIVSRVRRDSRKQFEDVIAEWEFLTNFKTEEVVYAAVYSKDVNNYIAVKYAEDEKTLETCKTKGSYANPWPDKDSQIFRFHINPTFQICTEAIQAMLLSGKPCGQTIRECSDITKFVSVRDVKGGGQCNGEYVGKFVRWYIASGAKYTINYIESGNTVPLTLGAKVCMDLPEELPSDIDYDWYENRCLKMLVEIGYHKQEVLTGQTTLL